MDAREQECSSRVNFPKELGVEGIDMGIKFTRQSSDGKAITLHFKGNRKVALRILLDVNEIPHRATTEGKEVFFPATAFRPSWSGQ